MDDRNAVSELDLLAYADGRLEGDPWRRDAVAAHLAAHPEDAARVRAYAAQDEEIRALYAVTMRQPVPDRLLAAVSEPDRRSGHRWLQMAATIMLMAVAGATGWVAGINSDDPAAGSAILADMAVQDGGAVVPGVVPGARGGSVMPAAAGAQPLNWLSSRLTADVDPPDLSANGYRLKGKRLVDMKDQRAVQLIYRSADGRELNLFVQPRITQGQPEFQVVDDGRNSVAFWEDGALSYALAATSTAAATLDMARMVQNSLQKPAQQAALGTVQREPSPTLPMGIASEIQ